MREPRRLLSHGATDFERRLLESMRSERPDAAMRMRMQRGLGLAGPLLWASNVKAMLSDAATQALGGAKLLGSKAGLSALGLTAASAVSAGGIAIAVGLGPSEQSTVPSDTAAPPALRVQQPAPVAELELTAPESLPSPPDAAGALREEIRLVDGARAALAAREMARAAALLETHRERFPDGLLEHEAKLLRARLPRSLASKSPAAGARPPRSRSTKSR